MPVQNQSQPAPAAPKPAKIKATYRLTINKECLYSLTAQFIEFYFTKNKTDTVVKNFINSFFVKSLIGRSLPIIDIPFFLNSLNPNTLPSAIANQLSSGVAQSFASHKRAILSYFDELLAIAVNSPAPAEVMTFSDFAKHLGVSVQTANAILEDKKIPYYALSPKKRMISVADYNSFLASIKTNPQGINAAIDNPEVGNTPLSRRRDAALFSQKGSSNPPKTPKGRDKDKSSSKNNASQTLSVSHEKKPSSKPFNRDAKGETKPTKPLKIESADVYSSEFGSFLKKKFEEELPAIDPVKNTPVDDIAKEPDVPVGGGENIKATIEPQEAVKESEDVKQPEADKQSEEMQVSDVRETEKLKEAAEPVVKQIEEGGTGSDRSTGESKPDNKPEKTDSPASMLDSAPIPSPAEVRITEVVKPAEFQINTPELEIPEIPHVDKEDDILPTINITPANMSQALQTNDKTEGSSDNTSAEMIDNQEEQPPTLQYHSMSSEDILKAQQKLNNLCEDGKTDGNNQNGMTPTEPNMQRKRVLIKTK